MVRPTRSRRGTFVFRLKILPTATMLARWMAYLGLVCGVLYSVGGLVVDVLYSVGGLVVDVLTIGLNWGTAMAFMALVGMPIVFGTFGFLSGALFALIARGAGAVLDRMKG